jgi:hypothetical protein
LEGLQIPKRGPEPDIQLRALRRGTSHRTLWNVIFIAYPRAFRYAHAHTHTIKCATAHEHVTGESQTIGRSPKLLLLPQHIEIHGSDEESLVTFLTKIGTVGRTNLTKLNHDSGGFWMYDSPDLALLLKECTGVRELKVCIHGAHLLRNYKHIRACIMDQELDCEGVEVFGDSISIFALLVDLQILQIKIGFPTWSRTGEHHQPRELVQDMVKKAVKEEIQDLLKSDVEVFVVTEKGAPKVLDDLAEY